MNDKTIIEFGFRITAEADNTLLYLHNSSDDTQPYSIIVKYLPPMEWITIIIIIIIIIIITMIKISMCNQMVTSEIIP